MKNFRIIDPNIVCASCTSSIDLAIKELNIFYPLLTYELDVDAKSLTIHVSDDSAEEIKNRIKQATEPVGFFDETCAWEEIINKKESTLEKSVSPVIPPETPKNTIIKHLMKGLPCIIIGALWISLPFIPIANVVLLSGITIGLAVLSTLIIFYAGWEIFVRAFQSAKRKHITMDTQFAISVLVALVISWIAFGVTDLSLLFDAALLILGFRHIGLAIEEWAKRKIDTGNSLLDRVPKTVERWDGDRWIQVATTELVTGNKIRIPRGETIPVDGICTSEQAELIAPDLSGQTDVFIVQKNSKLLQGYQVTSDFVEMLVERPMLDSTLACMQNQAKTAATKRMDIMPETVKIGANFVKGIFILTLLSFGFVALYASFVLQVAAGVALMLALKTALGVLVAACPCTFGSIIPLIGKTGTYKCLKNGATLLGANVLGNIAKAKYVVLDLNGTLTTGEKKVSRIQLIDRELPAELSKNKIYAYLKFLEKDSQHLVGQAIYAYLDQHYPTETLAKIDELTKINHGMGLSLDINGQLLMVGNKDLLQQKNIDFDLRDFPVLPPMTQRNYMAYGNKVIGYVDIKESLRPEAREVLDYFRAKGMGVKLCTGADADSAMSYAQLLGFDLEDVRVGCSVKPNSESAGISTHPKVEYIKSLQKDGPVMFIGDAGNDTAPIAEADVGVAVDSPTMSEANKTGANVYIGQRSLWPLVTMHAIAKQAIFNIKFSLGASFFYNLTSFVCMGGLLLFHLHFTMNPGFGAAIMVGQAVIILLFAAVFRIFPVPRRLKNPEVLEAAMTDTAQLSTHVGTPLYSGMLPKAGLVSVNPALGVVVPAPRPQGNLASLCMTSSWATLPCGRGSDQSCLTPG